MKNFECSVCLKKFRSKDNMQLHRKIHNDIKNTDKNKVKKSAVSYFSSPGGARGFSCPSLGKPFDIGELRRRLKTCKLCSITFDTKKLYNGHMKLHLVKDSSKKTEIDSSKETEVESSKETEVDSSKEMEVDSSKETEASHVTLVDQKAVVHGEKKPQFACENCEKTFTRNAYMKKHLILCSKKNSEDEKSKKHQCKFCNKKFSSNQNLKSHTKIKHDEEEFIDGKRTFVKDKHLKKSKLSFKCIDCGKEFLKKNSLKIHIKTHEEKPVIEVSKEAEISDFNESDLSGIDLKLGTFQCDLCTDMFISETNLITHQELKHDVSFQSGSPVLAVPQSSSQAINN